jgi:hypothetical protein
MPRLEESAQALVVAAPRLEHCTRTFTSSLTPRASRHAGTEQRVTQASDW